MRAKPSHYHIDPTLPQAVQEHARAVHTLRLAQEGDRSYREAYRAAERRARRDRLIANTLLIFIVIAFLVEMGYMLSAFSGS